MRYSRWKTALCYFEEKVVYATVVKNLFTLALFGILPILTVLMEHPFSIHRPTRPRVDSMTSDAVKMLLVRVEAAGEMFLILNVKFCCTRFWWFRRAPVSTGSWLGNNIKRVSYHGNTRNLKRQETSKGEIRGFHYLTEVLTTTTITCQLTI